MLYHREVFWKDIFDTQALGLIKNKMRLSHHLSEHIKYDNVPRYNFTMENLYERLHKLSKPFEVETVDNILTKAVYRVPLDEHRDISIVVRNGLVVTAWCNNKSDTHKTLNTKKYFGGKDR